ncbi:hypothetical protein AAG906_035039 [Vitis piasezkii]|uniref:Pathogenesis-related protein STH-21 n=1 Tax=Vitis vinifera TaxID=29760 RepID=A0A438FY19_VITVI|nr:Pathogenesis-related protein STH-21 [Vitis vinifera]
MGVVSFAQESESPVAPGRLFKALILDSHNLCPKLMPQSIKSIDIIQGDGGVGTIKQTNFTRGIHIKHRIDEVDNEKCRCKFTLIEGDVMGEKLRSAAYEIEFMDDGEGGSICRMLSEYETVGDVVFRDEDIEEGKEKATELFKPVEAFLLANPDAYA